MVFHPAHPEGQEKGPTGYAGRSVDLFAENERHLIAERIAQHPAEDRRDGAHHHSNHGREPQRQGLVEPQDGKQPDADSVEKEHRTPQAQDVTMEEIGGQNASGYDHQIVEVFHPADGGGAQQDIPDGASPQRRQECDHKPSEEVELLLRGREKAADGENEGTRQVEGVNEIHSMLRGSCLCLFVKIQFDVRRVALLTLGLFEESGEGPLDGLLGHGAVFDQFAQ